MGRVLCWFVGCCGRDLGRVFDFEFCVVGIRVVSEGVGSGGLSFGFLDLYGLGLGGYLGSGLPMMVCDLCRCLGCFGWIGVGFTLAV